MEPAGLRGRQQSCRGRRALAAGRGPQGRTGDALGCAAKGSSVWGAPRGPAARPSRPPTQPGRRPGRCQRRRGARWAYAAAALVLYSRGAARRGAALSCAVWWESGVGWGRVGWGGVGWGGRGRSVGGWTRARRPELRSNATEAASGPAGARSAGTESSAPRPCVWCSQRRQRLAGPGMQGPVLRPAPAPTLLPPSPPSPPKVLEDPPRPVAHRSDSDADAGPARSFRVPTDRGVGPRPCPSRSGAGAPRGPGRITGLGSAGACAHRQGVGP